MREDDELHRFAHLQQCNKMKSQFKGQSNNSHFVVVWEIMVAIDKWYAL